MYGKYKYCTVLYCTVNSVNTIYCGIVRYGKCRKIQNNGNSILLISEYYTVWYYLYCTANTMLYCTVFTVCYYTDVPYRTSLYFTTPMYNTVQYNVAYCSTL